MQEPNPIMITNFKDRFPELDNEADKAIIREIIGHAYFIALMANSKAIKAWESDPDKGKWGQPETGSRLDISVGNAEATLKGVLHEKYTPQHMAAAVAVYEGAVSLN